MLVQGAVMRLAVPVVLAACLSTACNEGASERTLAERTLAEIQRSHIEANVPKQADFERVLRRDLGVYFADGGRAPVNVAFDFLRDGPTQSGVAYPKYYLWVRVGQGTRPQDRGAVRVAAIDGEKFEVTDFLSEADILGGARNIEKVFPAPVCERIRAKLAR